MVVDKDSAEVAEFLSCFSQVKIKVDDEPERLIELTRTDASVSSLCSKLWYSSFVLRRAEEKGAALFAAPVDPKFIKSWRDFELRYERHVAHVELIELIGADESVVDSQARDQEFGWNLAQENAGEVVQSIENVFAFAKDQIAQEWRDFPEETEDAIRDGIQSWDYLKSSCGIDITGIVRRRNLVPFILVPRSVHNQYGNALGPSMLANLREAQFAFVVGHHNASLALIRSVIESVLRNHYKISGETLDVLISNARKLPEGASIPALHNARMLANAVLHVDRECSTSLRLRPLDLEKRVLWLLTVLRCLIEGAP